MKMVGEKQRPSWKQRLAMTTRVRASRMFGENQ